MNFNWPEGADWYEQAANHYMEVYQADNHDLVDISWSKKYTTGSTLIQAQNDYEIWEMRVLFGWMRIGVHAGEGMLWRGRSQRSDARPMRDKAKPPGLTTPSATNANATLKVSYPLHSVSGISSNRANQKAPQAFFDTLGYLWHPEQFILQTKTLGKRSYGTDQYQAWWKMS